MIKIVPIDDVKASEYNPRKNDEKRLAITEMSLRKLGFVLPIYADKSGEILSGHQRQLVAKRMGFKEIPVSFINEADLNERKTLNVLFNRATNDLKKTDTCDNIKNRLYIKDVESMASSLPDIIRKALAIYEPMLEDATAQIQEYGAMVDETGAFTENFMKTLDGLAFGTNEATTATENNTSALTDEEQGIIAASEAWGEYIEDIKELCVAYDEAYQAALESFQGQFGLFEQASMQSDTYLNSTVANAQAALESQLAYWTEYSNNIEVLKNISAEDLGITQENYDALMSYVQSGSEEAAGLAASMVKELESGHTESVTELANTLNDVTAKQEEIAATTADWITGFSEQVNTFALDMTNTIVNDLDLSDEAQSSGFNTIVSYASAITNNGGKAVEAAQSIADRVSAALASANTSINIGVSGSVPGHATGTTNAEDVFVAGENGPELIVGKAGSTVFPNSETNKIISALHDVGGASYGNSYTTANAITDNSAVNQYSNAYENYNQTESTRIFNNYTNVENGSSYDDSAIIHYLDSFVSICSAIAREVSNDETQVQETPAEIPEIVNIVDLSVLDDMIAKFRSGGDVSNFDESITYGDTQNIDNSRSYSTEYGDNDLSRAFTETTNYGDVAQSIENSHRYGDRDYETTTSYNAETSLSTSAESVINDVSDSIFEHGDMLRSYNDVLNYGDTVKRNDSSEQTDISKSWEITYSSDNSRGYKVLTNYGDTVRSYEESVRGNDSYYNAVTSYDNEQSYTASTDTSYGDTFGSEITYGDIIRTITENVERKYEENNNPSNSTSNSRAESFYSRTIRNIYQNETNSSSNSLQKNENTLYQNNSDKTVDYGGDNFKDNYTTAYQSEAYYSNSDGSKSIPNGFISNAAAAIAEYGDSTFTDSSNYNTIDTKSNFNSFYYGNSTIYSNISNNDYNGDNSVFTDRRAYETMTNSSSTSYPEYVTNSNGDAIETATTYGDSINSIEKNYNNSANSSQTVENGVTSVFIPMWEIITNMLEKSFRDNFAEIERYYSSTERFEADSAELVSPEIVIDSPYVSVLESENRIITGATEESQAKIMPPEPNDIDEKDNGKDGDTRHIVIEIAGSGSIDISNGVDREQVLELLQENLKPVLMNIISSEIYEEGELSYDF